MAFDDGGDNPSKQLLQSVSNLERLNIRHISTQMHVQVHQALVFVARDVLKSDRLLIMYTCMCLLDIVDMMIHHQMLMYKYQVDTAAVVISDVL
jgi:hypothetical protein